MKNNQKVPTCHPNGIYAARGLCSICYSTEHRKKNIEKYRAAGRKYTQTKKYDMEEGHFEALLQAQGNKCAICYKLLVVNGNLSYACIDHDHLTGEIRGILCIACNTGIGHLKDNPVLCVNAANYLFGVDLVGF